MCSFNIHLRMQNQKGKNVYLFMIVIQKTNNALFLGLLILYRTFKNGPMAEFDFFNLLNVSVSVYFCVQAVICTGHF